MTFNIPAAVAEELYESADGTRVGEWKRVTDYEYDSGRWTEHHYLIVTKGDGFFGVHYELGLTEMQEHHFPWQADWNGNKPETVKLVPMVSEQVTTTVYRLAKS